MSSKFEPRLKFLKQSALGLLGLTVLSSSCAKVAPNDRLRVAHIGLGGMGNNHKPIDNFMVYKLKPI